ncbi:long-chain acyl-CoA synthetase [Geomicrobium halophilum]|uniref:Long-chain acyl-CoA synthetase n=1 Tax=Geomicrobium halophilum TaxID=549000 RepID=A0A841PR54_9BACL|nr:AMP-binding protein [Geomicrobium halophilum]MBB6450294.1 long-chain acyl-CoA synthetase [Geomicrobium halophilum]
MNIAAPIFTYAKRQPDKTAIVHGRRSITYQTLADRISRVMQYMNGFCNKTMRVGILSHNHIEAIETALGTVLSGHLIVMLDQKWTTTQLIETIRELDIDIVFTDAEFAEVMKDQTTVVTFQTMTDDPLISYSNWVMQYSDTDKHPALAPGGKQPFYIGFTSGTTSRPKGFIRNHDSWIESFHACRPIFNINQDSHVVTPGPMVHSLFLFTIFQTLFEGATLYILKNFSEQDVIHLVQHYPITTIYLVPTMTEAMIHQLPEDVAHLNKSVSLINSGDKLTKGTKQRLYNVWPNANLYEFYGASELSFVSVSTPGDHEKRPDSVGRPFYNVEVSIQDQSGKPLPMGEVGTLYVKSNMLFNGYMDQAETAKVFQNGWATTGDLAKIDGDGYLYLVGREKNRIISGGWNIFPEKVEEIIKQHSGIKQAVVIGISSRFWGEIPALILEGNSNFMNRKELRQSYQNQLQRHEWPRKIYSVDTFPYTPSGKIARGQLKELIMKEKRENKKVIAWPHL